MTAAEHTNVLLIDDHPAVRQGLALLLAQADHLVCAEAGNHAEVRSYLRQGGAGMAILDLHLGSESGFDLIAELRAHQIPVLVYSMYEDASSIRQVFANGASGYVCKREVSGELLAAVTQVLQGGRHVSPVAANSLAGSMLNDRLLPHENELSDRERQILSLLGEGRGNQDIADRLSLSVRTVESYCARAIDKLGLDGMKDLRRYAIQNHHLFLSPDA